MVGRKEELFREERERENMSLMAMSSLHEKEGVEGSGKCKRERKINLPLLDREGKQGRRG